MFKLFVLQLFAYSENSSWADTQGYYGREEENQVFKGGIKGFGSKV